MTNLYQVIGIFKVLTDSQSWQTLRKKETRKVRYSEQVLQPHSRPGEMGRSCSISKDKPAELYDWLTHSVNQSLCFLKPKWEVWTFIQLNLLNSGAYLYGAHQILLNDGILSRAALKEAIQIGAVTSEQWLRAIEIFPSAPHAHNAWNC